MVDLLVTPIILEIQPIWFEDVHLPTMAPHPALRTRGQQESSKDRSQDKMSLPQVAPWCLEGIVVVDLPVTPVLWKSSLYGLWMFVCPQ